MQWLILTNTQQKVRHRASPNTSNLNQNIKTPFNQNKDSIIPLMVALSNQLIKFTITTNKYNQ
jgi:hypothetical protein